MNIFVGNLSKDVTNEELVSLFSEFGYVKSAKVIRDMFNQESKGFGFVDMPGLSEAQKAIEALNTKEYKGKKLTVSEAKSRVGNERRGGRDNQRGYGGGRGGDSRFGRNRPR